MREAQARSTILAQHLAPYKLVKLTLEDGAAAAASGEAGWLDRLSDGVTIEAREAETVTLRVPRAKGAPVASSLLQRLPVADLAIETPPIERVIETIYQAEAVPR